MPTCFVMQPFDGGVFDQRYKEVFEPAIKAADVTPYRVDEDPKVSIPIDDIEKGIRQSRLCLAEITHDNPNVWFELGYAMACKKEVVLICSDARTTRFPFDVQHRTIIRYTTGSPSDFEALKTKITEKIKAYMTKSENLSHVSEMSHLTASVEGLSEHETVALATVAQNLEHSDDYATPFQIRRDMESSGYTKLATNFALKSLTMECYLEGKNFQDFDGDNHYGYVLTDIGWNWVLKNQHRFVLRTATAEPKDDDIPF